jgi:hypothetical protein
MRSPDLPSPPRPVLAHDSRMPTDQADSAPMELEVADGGTIVVEFADDEAWEAYPAIETTAAATRVDGPEGELEEAIVLEAEHHHLTAAVTGRRDPTRVTIERLREG